MNRPPMTQAPMTHAPMTPAPTHASMPHASMPHTSVPHTSMPRTSMPRAAMPHASMPRTSMPRTSMPRASMTRATLAALTALALTTACNRDQPTAPAETPAATPTATPPDPATAPATAPATPAPTTATPPAPSAPDPDANPDPNALPPSDRVYLAPLDGRELHLLTTDANTLAAHRLTTPPTQLWRITGPGVIHQLTYGDLGDGPRLYAAWGTGRGHLQAPLVITAIDPQTGTQTELWRGQGERNEAAHLAIADTDRDGTPELDFVRYTSKYMVAPQPIKRDGTTTTGQPIRMASSWLRAEMDGDRGEETIIGRVYGDDRGQPGDLRIITPKATLMVPTDNGVKSLLYATIGGEASALYFADGWVADYGKAAKAHLKRVRIIDGKPEVEPIGTDPEDFTFFALTAIDIDGDRLEEIVAQGSKRVVLFSLIDEQWQMRPLATLDPVLNTAVGRTPDGNTTLFIPARPATRAVILK